MHILVATHETNGEVEGDFDHCVEGELVYMQEPCGRDKRDPSGPCGCARGFAGMNSHRATTTAMVVDSPMDEAQVREALRSSLIAGGWLDETSSPPSSRDPFQQQLFAYLTGVAREVPVGTVVRRHFNEYFYVTHGPGPLGRSA